MHYKYGILCIKYVHKNADQLAVLTFVHLCFQ